MILRICRRFIQHTDWFSVECHEVALEAQISYPSDIFFSTRVVIFEEERHRGSAVPERTVQGDFHHVVALGKVQSLSGLQLASYAEIHIVSVAEKFEGRWGRIGI